MRIQAILAGAAAALALAGCGTAGTHTAAPASPADQAACRAVGNMAALTSAGQPGAPVFAPGAVLETLLAVLPGTSQPLHRDLQAAKANALGTRDVYPGSLTASERDCRALGS
jgi:hypothetical protein